MSNNNAHEIGEVFQTLHRHDGQLKMLQVEVTGIKSDLKDQRGILEDIKGALLDTKAKQGPGIGQILTIIATGGAVIGMSAAAITTLVTSFVAPDLTRLRTEVAGQQQVIEQIQKDRVDEYRSLKLGADRRFEERLRRTEERLTSFPSAGWASTVSPKR